MTSTPTFTKAKVSPRLAVLSVTVLAITVSISVWYWERSRVINVQSIALQAFRERRLDDADRAAERWRKLRPNSSEPWYLKAKIELAREHPQESFEALKKAKEFGQPEEDIRVLTSVMQVFGGKYDGMEPILKRALDASSEPEPELAQALSRVYLASFQFAPATTTLQRWMRDAPDDPKPYLWRNEIDSRTSGDATAVVLNYREALRRDPTLIEARLGLADKLRLARRADEALKEYEAYLAIRPDSQEANRGAGQVALETGDTPAAIRYFNAVLAKNPKEPVALRELALIDIRSGQYERAGTRLKAAIEVDPFDPDLRFNLAKALKLTGKTKEYQQAIADTDRLRKDQEYMNELRDKLVSRPNDPKLRLSAAKWLLEHGHDKEGLEWTDLILKANPGDSETCLFLADYHKSKGNIGLSNYYKLAAKPADRPASH